MDTTAKRSSAQRVISWVIIVFVLGLLGFGAFQVFKDVTKQRPLIEIGGNTFRSELAVTDAEKGKGLGGRESIGKDEAMLFVFDKDDRWGIWMKGMKMPIDIIWLDADKKIVHIEADVQPDAEPYDIYKPSKPARYVIEMAAGNAKASDIKVGMQARFEIEEDK